VRARRSRGSPGRLRTVHLATALLGVLATAACTDGGGGAAGAGDGATGATEAPTAAPGTSPHRVTVTVGDAPPVRAEVADTPEERGRGLMGRAEVSPGTGMLFVFDGPTTSDFYMYRTRVALSIAFVADGRVVGVREMRPCRAEDPDDCRTYGVDAPYTRAVEAPGGHFTDAGVAPGDPVTVRPSPASPRR
jgi:uncharacterized protein